MRQLQKFDVVGLGGCAFDMLASVERFPKPDTKSRMEKYVQQGGGTAANTLITVARLGAKAAYMGKLGEDELSRFVINEFIREGVDTSNVIVEEHAGPYIALIIVDQSSGERTILWTDEMVKGLGKDELSEGAIVSSRVLYLDDWKSCTLEAALCAAEAAREAGVKVLLDAENPQKKEYLQLIKRVDFLVVSADYALGLSGCSEVSEASAVLLDYGPEAVVITQGARGCFVRARSKSFSRPAFEVHVADTTGCGDAFHGGFAYGLAREWPIEQTVEFASAVAALNCRKVGARIALPTLGEVKEFLRSRGSELEKLL